MVTGREARTSRNVVLDLGMLRAFHFSVLRNNVAGLICNCHVGPFIRSVTYPEILPSLTLSLTSAALGHSWHREHMADRYRGPTVARNLSKENRGCFHSKAPLTDTARRHRCYSGYDHRIARERAVFAFEPRLREFGIHRGGIQIDALRFERPRPRRTTHLVRSTV